MKSGLIITLLLGIFTLVACTETESDEFCSNPGKTCPDSSAIEATACCTNEDCHWVYNGANYNCDGDDCTDAIDAIVASACASSKSVMIDINETDYEVLKAQMQEVTALLLIEAREASGCVD